MVDLKTKQKTGNAKHSRLSLLTMFLLLTSLFGHSPTGFAQLATRKIPLPKVVLRSLGRGTVTFSKGSLHSSVDLSQEVVGCVYVSGANGINLRKRGCASSSATFKIIDATTQKGLTYVVLLADAADNCNVCGRCGATEGLALIWLELDANLHLKQKKGVHIEDCMGFISMVSPAGEVEETPNDNGLSFTDDVLTVEFEKRIFDEVDNDRTTYHVTHLKYSRKEPGLGFVLTTETRPKSGIGSQ